MLLLAGLALLVFRSYTFQSISSSAAFQASNIEHLVHVLQSNAAVASAMFEDLRAARRVAPVFRGLCPRQDYDYAFPQVISCFACSNRDDLSKSRIAESWWGSITRGIPRPLTPRFNEYREVEVVAAT